MKGLKLYTNREEKANYLTHAFGVLMALVGTYTLVSKANTAGNSWAVLAHSIFGFGMFICMLSSTLYHYVQEPKIKKLLRHLNHASIYLLIAGTYTPVALIALEQSKGWPIFWVVWGIALLGLVLKIFFTGRFEVFSVIYFPQSYFESADHLRNNRCCLYPFYDRNHQHNLN